MRLDKYLQQKFSLRSRTYSENLIKTGRVCVNGKPAERTSLDVGEGDSVEIISDESYASQGAYKLQAAFEEFCIDVVGKACADIGCSNGGFTDCLLRRGAGSVLAVDVAECALDKRLLEDGRVTFLRANARQLPDELADGFDFVCTDVSFISLRHVLPQLCKLLKSGGEGVALIKPQFELTKSALNKRGVVSDEALRDRAVQGVVACAESLGLKIKGLAASPVRYENKNTEYLLWFNK